MFLHESTIYGPLTSRRLGTSLGINLLPTKRKVCNFECVYCECGWTDKSVKDQLPTLEEFTTQLETRLKELAGVGKTLDHITFAGNGEPTLHQTFSLVIDETIRLRNQYFPKARIAVLSNATRLGRSEVFEALQKIDDPILKLDAGTETMFQRIDIPDKGITLDRVTRDLKKFNGNLVIQTLFLRGHYKGDVLDNTSETEVTAWIKRLKEIGPRHVMIYPIDRDTPVNALEKISKDELNAIAQKAREAGISTESFG